MPVLLVIDDDPLILKCFTHLFSKKEATVVTATSAKDGLKFFNEMKPDVVVLDVRLPDLSGLEAFKRFHKLDARVPLILITGHATSEMAIEAMRMGAYEYVVKPLDPDALRDMITRAFEIRRLMRVPARMPSNGLPVDDNVDALVGSCLQMQEVYKAIGRVAPQDVTALILGESGTGKELVARAIYHHSKRADGPFLAINCAAIPETLLESELFGHEKGSFTGAERKRIGKFEQCNGGTLFLDEIGDMTPLTQTKVLRVLQDKEFQRVGGNEPIKTDVRIIAATNRKLEKAIEKGQFRQDLYYRLNVYTIPLPPLRERPEDIPELVMHFLKRFSRELGKEMPQVTDEALEVLKVYNWPGNVRELQSALKQALLLATGPVLLPEYLPASVRGHTKSSEAAPASQGTDLAQYIAERLEAGSTDLYAEVLALVERQMLLQVLRNTDSNLSQAARILGINRTTLRTKLSALGISVERAVQAAG